MPVQYFVIPTGQLSTLKRSAPPWGPNQKVMAEPAGKYIEFGFGLGDAHGPAKKRV